MRKSWSTVLLAIALVTLGAFVARANQTQKIDALQSQITDLLTANASVQAENAQLKAQVTQMVAENASLQAEVARLQPADQSSAATGDSAVSVTSGSSSSPASSSTKADRTVYITKTGSKYHRSGCQYLSRSCIPISLGTALNSGYTPCSVCGP